MYIYKITNTNTNVNANLYINKNMRLKNGHWAAFYAAVEKAAFLDVSILDQVA